MNRLSFVLLALVGCQNTYGVGQLDRVLDLPAVPNRDVDMLFVIDDSPSMLDKQAALVASFPKMMDALATLDGGLPNLHIGVISSDMGSMASMDTSPAPGIGSGPGSCMGIGDDGNLQHFEPSSLNVPAPELGGALYISDVGNADGSRTRNYTGELRDVFTKIASLGAGGCGFEQHFASMRRALSNPANGDFVRPTANLAVVFLADEDDCSMSHSTLMGAESLTLGPLQSFRCTRFGIECDDHGVTPDEMAQIGAKGECRARATSPYVEDVSPFVNYLTALKGDPRAVMVAAIAGPTTPIATELRIPPGGGTAISAVAHSCMYMGIDGQVQVADPAVRIAELVDSFPGRGSFSTVCDDDLSISLSSVGYTAKKLVGDPCIDVPLADSSSLPGLQPLCSVLDDTVETPPCDGTNLDHCWQVITDPLACPAAPDQLRFKMLRSVAPVPNTYVSVRCLRAS